MVTELYMVERWERAVVSILSLHAKVLVYYSYCLGYSTVNFCHTNAEKVKKSVGLGRLFFLIRITFFSSGLLSVSYLVGSIICLMGDRLATNHTA